MDAGGTADRVTLPVVVRDLLPEDLERCGWSGSPLHLAAVAKELTRVRAGEVDYLAVCPPSGLPVAIGAVDHVDRPGVGKLFQLVVHPALRSCGLGTRLIAAAEHRVRVRGLAHAEIDVEEDNSRARALYERLGYVAYGSAPVGWDEERTDGSVTRYETVCTLMRKRLP
nr:GNAT family N-acetyltransferase [Streptomyces radicis]